MSFHSLTGLVALSLVVPTLSIAQVEKEEIDSGTPDYRLVRYLEDTLNTCIAYVCPKRNSQRCSVRDELFSLTKRTAEDYIYVSYYPFENEADKSLKTSLQIATFAKRTYEPIQNWPNTWIVPYNNESDDILDELERALRPGPVSIKAKTEGFPERRMILRDLEGMKRDILRLCPDR